MTQCSTQRLALARRAVALCLLVTTASGCSFTQTSTAIRSVSDPPTQHLRLTRSDTPALTGAFRQEGHAVVGQLAFNSDCTSESTQTVRHQSVTETRTNRTTAITYAVIGGVFTALGTGLLVASQSADQQVSCGNDSSGPKEGDQCHSVSGLESDAGFGTLLTGLTVATTAAIFLARKPHTETSDLPPEQVTHVTTPVTCGSVAALDGMVLALELPGNGTWTGSVASDGSLRIDVNEKIPLPEQATVSVVVESVPASLAGLVAPGAPVGALTLSGSHAEPGPSPRRKLASRH